jgi:hypothetical protein
MLSLLFPLLALCHAAAALWPLPTIKHSLGISTLWISDNVSIDVVSGNVRSIFFTEQSVME